MTGGAMQIVIVGAIVLVAAGVVVWRMLRPFVAPPASGTCGRCENSKACAAAPDGCLLESSRPGTIHVRK